MVTLGTGAMAEPAAGLLLNVGLHLVPIVMFVTHLLAVSANRNQLLQLADFRRAFQDPFRYPEAQSNGFAIQRFRKEVVHARSARQLMVDGAGMICREKDEIGVGSFGVSSNLFAKSQPVQSWHHPITHEQS